MSFSDLYVENIKKEFYPFINGGSLLEKVSAVDALIVALNDPKATEIDKAVAALTVVAEVIDSLQKAEIKGVSSKLSSIPVGTIATIGNFVKDARALVVKSRENKATSSDVLTLTSSGLALGAEILSSLPGPGRYNGFILGAEAMLRFASGLSSVVAVRLPDYEELKAAVLQDIREMEEIYLYNVDEFISISKNRIDSLINQEALLVDESLDELVSNVSSRWSNSFIDADYKLYLDIKRDEISANISEKVLSAINNYTADSAETLLYKLEEIFGIYDHDAKDFVGGQLDALYDVAATTYLPEVKEYVSERLLEIFESQLDDAINSEIESSQAFIYSELRLINKIDSLGFTNKVSTELISLKAPAVQTAQGIADNSEDNSTLKDKLTSEKSDFQTTAESTSKVTRDQASQYVKGELERDARAEISDFLNSLLEDVQSEVGKEREEIDESESSCETSHQKIDAWSRELAKKINDLLNTDLVRPISESSTDNADRKARLAVLVENIKNTQTDNFDADKAAVDAISESIHCEENDLDPAGAFKNAERQGSPIILDLDGDGVETRELGVMSLGSSLPFLM